MSSQLKNTSKSGSLRKALICGLLSLLISPVFACDAPEESFCASFYKGIDLEGIPRVRTKVSSIKYDWGNSRPFHRIPYDNFSARWKGRFLFAEGEYEFRVNADEGIRLMLDGKLIMDHWNDRQKDVYSTQVALGTGTHLIEVEYFDSKGNAYLDVNWKLIPKGTTAYENKAPIGINLSYFSYSSAAVPFKDLIAQSGLRGVFKNGSNEPCPTQPKMSDTGYPFSLAKDCIFRFLSAFHILNDKFWPANTQPYQRGRYVLLYQGKGDIHLGWDAKNVVQKEEGRIEFDVPAPGAGIRVEVRKTEVTDPISDIHIVHLDDETTFRTQPFNEKWLDLLKPFSVIRFSAWGKVSEKVSPYSGTALSHTPNSIVLPSTAPANTGVFDNSVAVINVNGKWPRVMIDHYDGLTKTLYLKTPIDISQYGKQPTVYIHDFLNRTWASRTLPAASAQGARTGVAFETMIQLANTLNINPWITIPTAADDDFVEQLAILIKTQLKPHLKCYIEYSNETWNSRFPGYHYSEAKAKELQLEGTGPQGDAWQAYRAVEIFRVFNRVFGEQDFRENRRESRLVRVLTSQTAWLARAVRVMDWKMPNNAWPTQGEPAHKYADAWAITTYFSSSSIETLEQANMDELKIQQIDSIDSLFGSAENPGIIRQTLSKVNSRGLQLVTYEGGTHLLAPHNKSKLVSKLAEVNKNLIMTEVYKHLLKQWDSLYQEFGSEKIGIWNHYSDVSRYSKHGYWGLMQSTYQAPVTAPKYQAIKEYVLGFE